MLVEGKPAATIVDATPLVHIPPFGMCTSLANPTVAAATAAALGDLTPMPCVPATTPLVNGATGTTIGGQPALVLGAQCQCAWGRRGPGAEPGQHPHARGLTPAGAQARARGPHVGRGRLVP